MVLPANPQLQDKLRSLGVSLITKVLIHILGSNIISKLNAIRVNFMEMCVRRVNIRPHPPFQ